MFTHVTLTPILLFYWLGDFPGGGPHYRTNFPSKRQFLGKCYKPCDSSPAPLLLRTPKLGSYSSNNHVQVKFDEDIGVFHLRSKEELPPPLPANLPKLPAEIWCLIG